MGRNVGVTLLETVVLLDVVQVVTANNDCESTGKEKNVRACSAKRAQRTCSLHLVAVNDALENTATDRDVASEGALLVNVVSLNRLLRGAEAQTNVAVQGRCSARVVQRADTPEEATVAQLVLAHLSLGANEDTLLLLESTLGLSSKSQR